MCFPALSQRDEKRWLGILYSAHKRGVLSSHSEKKQGKDLVNSHFQRASYEVDHTLNVI